MAPTGYSGKQAPRTLARQLAPEVSVALGVMALLRGHWEFVPKPFSPLVALEPLPALSLGLPQWYSSVIPLPLVFSGVS